MEKRTPLYQTHIDGGARIVPFAGYLMPVQYDGVIAEHMATRTKAGLFDVSHMAELLISGPDALKNIDMLVTSQMSLMEDGQIKYGLLCNEQGGIVDDLMVYRQKADKYLLVVNAGNHEKDEEWVRTHLIGDVKMQDISDSVAQIALQGPVSKIILSKLCDAASLPEKYYTFKENIEIQTKEGKATALISRTGYTGEDGYEIYCDSEDAVRVWNALLSAGQDDGLLQCGLGARDTLRLEASMPLYGHELNDEITPLEAGLGMFVKLDKPEFIGKEAILAKGAPKIKRVGLKITGRGIAREESLVYIRGEKAGIVTSGTLCPFLGYAVAMAYIPVEEAVAGNKVEIDVRGRMVEAEIVKMPFYKRQN